MHEDSVRSCDAQTGCELMKRERVVDRGALDSRFGSGRRTVAPKFGPGPYFIPRLHLSNCLERPDKKESVLEKAWFRL